VGKEEGYRRGGRKIDASPEGLGCQDIISPEEHAFTIKGAPLWKKKKRLGSRGLRSLGEKGGFF